MKKETIYNIFSKIPRLETERLFLRAMKQSDAPDMFEYASGAELTKYLMWYPHPNVNYTENYLSYVASRYRVGDFYDWALVLKDGKKMIGTCGYTKFDFSNNSGEVGYVINPAYQHNGYATEAVKRVIKFGFDELGLNRVEAHFMEENEISRHVMEKCGMKFEGIARGAYFIKGRYENVGICAVLKNEFSED